MCGRAGDRNYIECVSSSQSSCEFENGLKSLLKNKLAYVTEIVSP